MEQYERIKEIRKTLGLTLEKFGNRVGVGKSAISNIENGNRGITEQMQKAICREFNVSEEWLRDGVGSMFVEPDTFSLDDFAKSRGMTDLEKEIIKTYFEIDPDIRKIVLNHFKEKLLGVKGAPETPEELEFMHPPVSSGDESSNAG